METYRKVDLLLNAKKLILDGYLVLRRDKNNKIIPCSQYCMEDDLALWIFFGQLSNTGTYLKGVGRRIVLVPRRDSEESIVGYRKA